MADGFGSAGANTVLDSLGSTYPWVQLHTGLPGSAGASNVAAETTRKQATFASASGGSKASSADLTWTSVAGSETYSHFSLWTASTNGSFGGSGSVTANAVTAGDTFTISSGSLVLSATLAS